MYNDCSARESRGFPLTLAPQGSNVRIVRIDAGHGLRSRLEAMGFIPGETVDIIQSRCHHCVVVSVKNIHYTIRMGIGFKIFVE